jgi:hypothetical protein
VFKPDVARSRLTGLVKGNYSMSPSAKRLLRIFALEMLVYLVLLVAYFLAVLQFLGQPLGELFHLNLWIYAGATLMLIIVQSVALELVTSFLIDRLGLERPT